MYYSNSDYLGSLLLGASTFILVLALAILVLTIVANWKIFTKAGQPGWASIVPFYCDYTEYKIYWGNGWLFLVPVVGAILAGVIPIIGWLFSILLIVWSVFNAKKIALAFGQGTGFAIGLLFLPTVFQMILGFGKAEYKGVPIDGTSYKELKVKLDGAKAKMDEHDAKTTFEQPVNEAPKDVKYEQPEASEKDVEKTVVEAEIVEEKKD